MIWSFVLAGVGVFGLWLAGRKNNIGWLVGLGAQFLWAAYAIATHQYGFLLSCLGYGWVYAKNYRAWRRPSPVVYLGDPGMCMCGSFIAEHGMWEKHSPVSETEYLARERPVDPPPTGRFTKHAWNRWYNRQLEPVDD